jgi:YegS/Rv2252/BmrU family lipid kinase
VAIAMNRKSEGKKLLFIVNKYSGTGYQPHVEGKILTACAQADIECTIEFTSGPGNATQLAKEAIAKGFHGVVAVGGDGTLNEVAQGLVNSAVPMGIIPKGSGNGLARHFGISMKIERSLQQLLTGEIIEIDTFKLNNRLSINVSGIGFDGHIANLFAKSKNRGFWTYTKLVVREYIRYKQFSAELKFGSKSIVHQKPFMIAIANASQYGNNVRVAPSASVINRSVQIAVVNRVPAQRGFHFAYQMFTGKLKTGKDYTCTTIEDGIIKTPFPVAYHIDGEAGGFASEFKIEVNPHSLRLMVPAASIGKI